MNVAIFGATGKTGRFVIEEALERGHRVVTLTRNPAKLDIEHRDLEVVTGDVLDPAAVEKTIIGQDAVISLLGAGMRPTTLRTDGTRTIVEAMKRQGVRRLVSQSIFGLGDGAAKLPVHWRLIVKPGPLRFAYRDHAGQEAVIAASGLDWTITRPVSLRDTEPTGVYQDGPAAAMDAITLEIGLTDLARFTLDQLETDKYLHRRPGISY
jgi:putative NADH-flavin reductase